MKMDVQESNCWNEKFMLVEQNGRLVLTDICRLCGDSSKNLISVLEGEGLENELLAKIEKYLPIKVSESDSLPKEVCFRCASSIIAWHDLTVNCIRIDEKFREILRDVVNEKEIESGKQNEAGEPFSALCDENAKIPDATLPLVKREIQECLMPDEGDVRLVQSSQNNSRSLQQCQHSLWNDCKECVTCYTDMTVECENIILCCSDTASAPQCVHCGENFVKKGELATHLAKNHSECVYHCEKCDKLYKEKKELLLHMKSHCDVSENVEEWPHTTASKENLGDEVFQEDHSYCTAETLKKAHKKSRKLDYVCVVCGSVFLRKQDLKRHCQTLHIVDNGDSKEDIAKDSNTRRRRSEVSSVKGYKKQKIFSCDKCGRNFTTKDSYARHYRIHTGERPFTCDVCGKQFRDGGGLRRHLRDVHDRIKSFGCDICGRFFASKATRDDHRRIHTGERPYICHSCGKTFKSKASLYIHSKVHTDYFPHHCSYCEKSFRRKQELMNHVTTHTGEKPHVCEICGKSFGVRGEMLRHKIIHSDEKPYTCSACGAGFKQKRYLRNHEKTHKKNT